MGSQLYDELAKLDRGIANRWRIRAKDNPAYKLKDVDIDDIFAPLINDTGISELEAAALHKLTTSAAWEESGRDLLRLLIRLSVQKHMFQRAGDVLVSRDELADVSAALGATGKIMFRSPGTRFLYRPAHYAAINELIVNKFKIYVFKVQMRGLDQFAQLHVAGEYRAEANHFYVYEGATKEETRITIVHEATHAIQDWQDVTKGKNKHVEADAYIAGAIADIQQRGGNAGTPTKTGKIFDPALKAAQLVWDWKAKDSNPDWIAAYNAVVADIETERAYQPTNEAKYQVREPGEGSSERDQMDDILKALAKGKKP